MVGPIDTPHEFVFVPDVGPVALDLGDEAGGPWTLVEPGRSRRNLAAADGRDGLRRHRKEDEDACGRARPCCG